MGEILSQGHMLSMGEIALGTTHQTTLYQLVHTNLDEIYNPQITRDFGIYNSAKD
jgi:hypothetical protein